MCIILACESNHRPSEDVLQTCWLHNPDGAGIAYPEGGVVRVDKGLMTYDEFLSAYAAMPAYVPCLIHFRIGTSGGTDAATMEALTHPFGVCSDLGHVLDPDGAPLVMAHNGILPYPSDALHSDTVTYAQTVLAPMRMTSCGAVRRNLRRIRKTSKASRLAFIDAAGDTVVVGAGWENVCPGVRASNAGWCPSRWIYAPDYYDEWLEPQEREEREYAATLMGCEGCAALEECVCNEAPYCCAATWSELLADLEVAL